MVLQSLMQRHRAFPHLDSLLCIGLERVIVYGRLLAYHNSTLLCILIQVFKRFHGNVAFSLAFADADGRPRIGVCIGFHLINRTVEIRIWRVLVYRLLQRCISQLERARLKEWKLLREKSTHGICFSTGLMFKEIVERSQCSFYLFRVPFANFIVFMLKKCVGPHPGVSRLGSH